MTETAQLPSPKASQSKLHLHLPLLTAKVQELAQMLPPSDLTQASQALQLLEQIVQDLEVMELPSLNHLMRAMQSTLQGYASTEAAAWKKNGELLQLAARDALEFVQTMEANAPTSPHVLFASYRELTKLSGKDTAHPADLWDTPWELSHLPAPVNANAIAPNGELRSQLDQHVLGLLRTSSPSFCTALYQQSLGLAAHANDGSAWQLAAAWLQALEYGLLELDIYAKRQASRLLTYYTIFDKGQEAPPANFVRDLLFFCAQAAQTAAQREQDLPTMLALVQQHCAPAIQPAKAHQQALTTSQSTEPDLDFLQAAETLSQQLDAQLSQWLADESAVLAPDTAKHAQKLARLAQAAGCADIAALTHLLHGCLQRIKANAPQQQRQTCHLAGEEINRLLHQFAAGFMRPAQPQVMDALHHLHAQWPEPAAMHGCS